MNTIGADMRIAKLGYSSAPWRLMAGDDELWEEIEIEHPTLGRTRCQEPICGDTKTEVIDKALSALAVARSEVGRLRRLLEDIEALASWHCDVDADPMEKSPEDAVAHTNGLIVQLCRLRRRTRC